MQRRAFTLKELMLLHVQHDVEVARWSPIESSLALFLVANSRAVLHTGWNIDLFRVLAHHATLAVTGATWIGHHLPRTGAVMASAGNRKEALLEAELSSPAASRTRGRGLARQNSAAMTVLAALLTAKFDLCLFAEDRFLKFEGEVRAQI